MAGTPISKTVSTRLRQIASLARNAATMAFTNLAHHIDLDLLREAHRGTRKDGAVDVDHQTAAQYAENLEGNLKDLLDRCKSGRYKAPPVRRVHIPKEKKGETCPLGIPTFEDKVLQRAVTTLSILFQQGFGLLGQLLENGFLFLGQQSRRFGFGHVGPCKISNICLPGQDQHPYNTE